MAWLDNLVAMLPGQSAPPGGYSPTTNVFGGTRPFGLGAPALAAAPATPLPRDATGDAVPAMPALPTSAYGAGGFLKELFNPTRSPQDIATEAAAKQSLVNNLQGVARGVDNFGRGMLGAPALATPPALGPVGLGMPAPRSAAPVVPAPVAPVAPVVSAPVAAAPVPATAPVAPQSGFGFHGLSPVTAQVLQGFLPRQKQPLEQVQQTIADAANANYQKGLAKLGTGASKADYDALMAQYQEAIKPLTVGAGMAQIVQSQLAGGM